MRVTPVPLARGLAVVLGTVAGVLMGRRRRALLESLAYTARGRSLAERRRLARRTFRNMASCAVDMFRLPSITPAKLRALFEIRGIEHLERAEAMGRGTIIVSGHIGPYELAAACVTAAGHPLHAIVENLDPAVLDALAAYRAATGMKLVNMKDGVRAAYRILGDKQTLLLAADRAIGEARTAIEVPFAGGIRRVPTGPATFSMATGAPIVVGFTSIQRTGRTRYLIEFDPPLVPQGEGEEERNRITQVITDRMSAFIESHPDHWFVFQPRWVRRAVG